MSALARILVWRRAEIRLFVASFVVGELPRHRLQQIQRLDDAISPEADLVPEHKRAVAETDADPESKTNKRMGVWLTRVFGLAET